MNDAGVPVATNWKDVAPLPAVKSDTVVEVMLADSNTIKLNDCVAVCTVPMVLLAVNVKFQVPPERVEPELNESTPVVGLSVTPLSADEVIK